LGRGAVEFLEQPFEDQTLLDAVNQAIEKDRWAKGEQAESLADLVRLAEKGGVYRPKG